jgi:trimethylamine--corrinoid protein Co-methyltransferase
VVTGVFGAGSLAVMQEMLACARGGAEALRERPLAVFSCCSTSPLEWSDVAWRAFVACGEAGIPVEIVPMPLSGFIAPATLAGTLVQHAAEALSGVVLSQVARPGAPVLWGGSTAIFDPREETAPMGAMETMLLACGASEVGKRLDLPTQAYVGLSDAKALDAQAGLETGVGAALAALAGINSVSGAGMLELENCQSLEKLVLDDEAGAMALRLRDGIAEDEEDDPLGPVFQELLAERHVLIADHTLRHRDREARRPGRVIDRARLSRFQEDGGAPLLERARAEVHRLEREWAPPPLAASTLAELEGLMTRAARGAGLDRLPFVR